MKYKLDFANMTDNEYDSVTQDIEDLLFGFMDSIVDVYCGQEATTGLLVAASPEGEYFKIQGSNVVFCIEDIEKIKFSMNAQLTIFLRS